MEENPAEVAPVVPENQELDFVGALKIVLRTSLVHDGLARGLNEAVKALDRNDAHLCILADSINEPAYTKLVTALCQENEIDIMKVNDSVLLGEAAGLCRYDAEGNPTKVVKCSCVVVKQWGEDTPALEVLRKHIGNQ